MIGNTILIFVFIFLNAIFAASETALIAINDSRVENDAAQGNKKAKRVLRFIKKPTIFLSTIQIGITLIGFLNGYVAGNAYSKVLVEWARPILPDSISISLISGIATLLVTLILTYFQVVLGELVPKSIAMKSPDKIIYNTVGMLSLIAKVLRPLVWLLNTSARGISKSLGINPDDEDNMTEEEIRMIVTSSGQKGVLDREESKMIENVLDFDDTEVSEIMTRRTEMTAIKITATKEEVIDIIQQEGYTRYPVYKEDIDHIIGMLHVKDLLKFIHSDNVETFNLKALVRKVIFVPDSKKTSALFKEMQKQKTHIAIALDEYGGTAGLITIEDLLEEIVGNIFDEYDDVQEELTETEAGVFIVDGLANIDDIESEIHIGLPIEEYDTLSGFVLGQIGRIPTENEHIEFDFNQCHFEVLEYDDHVISKIKVTKLVTPEIEENEDE